MDQEKVGLHKAVGICDDFLELAKDIGILALVIVFLILFFFHGKYLRQKLHDAGIALHEAGISDLGPIKLEALEASNTEDKKSAKAVDSLEQQITQLESKFAELAVKDPSTAEAITALKTQVATADRALKTSLLSQQQILNSAPDSVEPVGWIYVGQVNETRTSWAGIGAKNISPVPPAPKFQVGQTFSVTSDIYLRSGGNPSAEDWHAQSKIEAVLRQGEKVEFLNADYSHAKAGGWFLWLKVKPAS
ncbi:MAG TPA: hypothetical protein VGZ91_19845 [Candidatus Sulfotelmatobacter sp.]|jgi:hypothetical protein|nr:hypothetical protein [Candidatus Sulfotelmatobacter sp.]